MSKKQEMLAKSSLLGAACTVPGRVDRGTDSRVRRGGPCGRSRGRRTARPYRRPSLGIRPRPCSTGSRWSRLYRSCQKRARHTLGQPPGIENKGSRLLSTTIFRQAADISAGNACSGFVTPFAKGARVNHQQITSTVHAAGLRGRVGGPDALGLSVWISWQMVLEVRASRKKSGR